MAKRRKQSSRPDEPARAAMDAVRAIPTKPQTGMSESTDAPEPRDFNAPPDRHGPQYPARMPYGVPRLRAVLKLSDSVSVDDLCQEASVRLERLGFDRPPRLGFEKPPRASWSI